MRRWGSFSSSFSCTALMKVFQWDGDASAAGFTGSLPKAEMAGKAVRRAASRPCRQALSMRRMGVLLPGQEGLDDAVYLATHAVSEEGLKGRGEDENGGHDQRDPGMVAPEGGGDAQGEERPDGRGEPLGTGVGRPRLKPEGLPQDLRDLGDRAEGAPPAAAQAEVQGQQQGQPEPSLPQDGQHDEDGQGGADAGGMVIDDVR